MRWALGAGAVPLGLPGASVVAASLVLCAVAYAPVAILQRPEHALSASVVLSLIGLTVLCTAVAFMVFFALIREVGPVRATVVTYLNPAVAVVLGVAVLGESFGPATAAGFVLILGGSFLATRRSAAPVSVGAEGAPARRGPGRWYGNARRTPEKDGQGEATGA